MADGTHVPAIASHLDHAHPVVQQAAAEALATMSSGSAEAAVLERFVVVEPEWEERGVLPAVATAVVRLVARRLDKIQRSSDARPGSGHR